MKNQISQAIVSEKPNVSWDDVSGLVNAKAALKEAVILPIECPHLFAGSRTPWKGILLYGPPGTGKTFLAKACASEAKATFFSVSSSDLMSKFVGESEKLIKSLFNLAREKKPSIIFIDEVDSMTGSRSDGENEASRRVKTEFLTQMQGVGHDDTGILVLGATNLPWGLDPAIRRRFERRIYISLPEFEARYGMLKRAISKNLSSLTDEQIRAITERTDGFSGSDISVLVRDAVYEPIRRLQLATKFKQVNGKFIPCRGDEPGTEGNWMSLPKDKIGEEPVGIEDFQSAFVRTKPSVDRSQLEEYEKFTTTFGQDG